MYGWGCENDFAWYFTGECKVSVDVPEDICQWLAGCEYADYTSYAPEIWQHPSAFEQTRKGDCKNYALWAWRRLCELGYSAEFVVGDWAHDGNWVRHAWVVFRKEDGQAVLEGLMGSPEAMIRPLDDVREEYCPRFGVDHRLTRKIYSGYVASEVRGTRFE